MVAPASSKVPHPNCIAFQCFATFKLKRRSLKTLNWNSVLCYNTVKLILANPEKFFCLNFWLVFCQKFLKRPEKVTKKSHNGVAKKISPNFFCVNFPVLLPNLKAYIAYLLLCFKFDNFDVFKRKT